MDPRVRGTTPPRSVQAAWGVEDVVPLAGGQGSAFAGGGLVLKPVIDEAEAVWLAETLATLPDPVGFRLIRPVPASDGRWVVDGWAAWEELPGAVIAGQWQDTVAVGRDFHRHVASVEDGPPRRHHAWAAGDRYAWGEEDLDIPGPLAEIAHGLVDVRRSVDLPDQLVHGDLLNNILFDASLPPAVIDVSPYWRPARYAEAIVVADAIGWGGSGTDIAAGLADDDGRQLLLRAILFRLASAVVLVDGDMGRLPGQVAVYERLAALVGTP